MLVSPMLAACHLSHAGHSTLGRAVDLDMEARRIAALRLAMPVQATRPVCCYGRIGACFTLASGEAPSEWEVSLEWPMAPAFGMVLLWLLCLKILNCDSAGIAQKESGTG